MEFLFGEPPEEVKEELKRRYEREAAVEHLMSQDIKDLFESIEPPRLATLRVVFHSIASMGEDGFAIARYYEGLLAGLLTHVHGVCPGCGHDHADEFLEMATAEAEAEGDNSE